MTEDLTRATLETELEAAQRRGDIASWYRGRMIAMGTHHHPVGWTVDLAAGTAPETGDQVHLRSPREARVFTLGLRSADRVRRVTLLRPVGADSPYRYFASITADDVGRSSVVGRDDNGLLIRQSIYDVMGLIQRSDVGKRVYRQLEADGKWIMSVENDTQRDLRLSERYIASLDLPPSPDCHFDWDGSSDDSG